jgi:DNA end-binding protein Ku
MPATKKKAPAKKSTKKAGAARKRDAATAPAPAGRTRRPAWQGSISFGLINVPVQLYNTTTSHRIAFNQLDDKDHARIKQKRVSSETGKEVPYEHIVKGYEIEPGNYVILEKEELDDLSPERSAAMELESFIDAAQIDPLYYEASYFAVPAKNAAKPYAMLRDAMAAEDRAAVARLVMHQKEHLVALWPRDDMLVVSTLHFFDEVTDPSELPGESGPTTSAKAAELKAARQLVRALSDDFDIRKYRDEYRELVLELIEKKAKGNKIARPKKAAGSRKTSPRKRGSSGTHKTKAH